MNREYKSKSYSTINQIINNSIEKFYSSRPTTAQNIGNCQCMNNAEKLEEINYYQTQRQMITQASQSLFQQSRSDDERIIGQLLKMFIDYINKLIQMLNRNTLCPCKQQLLMESIVSKHKIQFIREENQKFFQLLQQKNQQCDKLNNEIKLLTKRIAEVDPDVRPITKRAIGVKPNQNSCKKYQNSMIYLNQQNWSKNMQDSIQSSKISINFEAFQPINNPTNSVKQKEHDIYFKDELKKSYKKHKIFNQTQQSIIKKSNAVIN